jgi:putative ABC transport system permease protein
MTIWAVALKYLRGRLTGSALTAVSVGLGVALIMATALLTQGIREAFIAGTTDYNLIVGAKGSTTQLVLNVVFRIDVPPPNIPYTAYEQLRADPRVEVAVPVMLGDAYRGFRYVATTAEYFRPRPWKRRSLAVSEGRLLRDDPQDGPSYEAVLGAEAAKRTGLRLGDRFYEGEEMAEHPLTVVGILRPTRGADDRSIFVSLASFWGMNELARQLTVKPLTAVLIRPKQLSDLPSLHREVNLTAERQAVLPSSVLLSIFNLLGLAEEVLHIVLAIVALVVFLELFVTMYHAALARQREIATMRALGARRRTVLQLVLVEACLIAAIGGVLGLVGGYGLAYLGAQIVAERGGVVLNPWVLTALQPGLLAATVGSGVLAGLIPAILAYRTEVAENLAPLS